MTVERTRGHEQTRLPRDSLLPPLPCLTISLLCDLCALCGYSISPSYFFTRLFLHPLHQALAGAYLARGELVAFALERVFVGAEFHAHRSAFEAEVLAEDAGEVAPVGIGDVLDLVAMDHDDRRVAAALVRVAQLDTPT